MKYLVVIPALALLAAAPQQDRVGVVAAALERGAAGEQSQDGEAMLQAAVALQALGARPATGEVDLVTHWLAEARRRGAKVQASAPYRGRALGPAYRRGVLGAGETLVTEQVFLAGQTAQVALVPEAARSLAIRIIAPDHKNLCERVAAPRAACDWLPMFTSRVRIDIVNRGNQSARYFLVSN